MLEVNICLGSSCHLKGAYEVLRVFQRMIDESPAKSRIEMKGQFCMKKCQEGVSVSVNGACYSVSPETAREFFIETVLNGQNL